MFDSMFDSMLQGSLTVFSHLKQVKKKQMVFWFFLVLLYGKKSLQSSVKQSGAGARNFVHLNFHKSKTAPPNGRFS